MAIENTLQQTIRELDELDEQAKRIRKENPDIVKWPGAIEPDPADPMKPAMDGLLIAMHKLFNSPRKPD